MSWESAIRPQLLERLTRPLSGGGVVSGKLAHGIYSRLERTRNIHPLTAKFLDRPSSVQPASESPPRVFARRIRDADVARSREGESFPVDETPSAKTVRSTSIDSIVASPTVQRSPVPSSLNPPTGEVVKPGETGQRDIETSAESRSSHSDSTLSRSQEIDRIPQASQKDPTIAKKISQSDRSIQPKLSESQKNETQEFSEPQSSTLSPSQTPLTKQSVSSQSFSKQRSPASLPWISSSISKASASPKNVLKSQKQTQNKHSDETPDITPSFNSDSSLSHVENIDRGSNFDLDFNLETTKAIEENSFDKIAKAQSPTKNNSQESKKFPKVRISLPDVFRNTEASSSFFSAQRLPNSQSLALTNMSNANEPSERLPKSGRTVSQNPIARQYPVVRGSPRNLDNPNVFRQGASPNANSTSRVRDRSRQKLTVVKPVTSAIHRTIETQIQKIATSATDRSLSHQSRESPVSREYIFRDSETESISESIAVPPSNSDAIDLDEITEKVLRKLKRNLVIERERRGQFS